MRDTCVPQLNLYNFVLNIEGFRGELDIYRSRGCIEFVLHPATQKIGLTHARIANYNHFVPILKEQIKILAGKAGNSVYNAVHHIVLSIAFDRG
jgi:hypothetical protein